MGEQRAKKGSLHPRNSHTGSYDFDSLVASHPPLRQFVALNDYGTPSINFFDPAAVRALNCSLLKTHYKIEWWEIAPTALTPPIPGRADHIHHLADLVGRGAQRCLDVGVGANCIYPIIGRAEYGWEFVGSDVSDDSLRSAEQIVERNSLLRCHVELRKQHDPKKIFEGVIRPEDRFDLTLCNPPFHSSAEAAARGTRRKLTGLGAAKRDRGRLNFGGDDNELWCEGGERRFIEQMIAESRNYSSQCRWFSSLISSEDNLAPLRRALSRAGAAEIKVLEMSQGNKRSRILAWRY